MIQTTLRISGMVCGMCEAHVNDAIRLAFRVRRVSSSRSKGETVILSDAPLDGEQLRRAITAAGYVLLSVHEETATKRPFLAALLKR